MTATYTKDIWEKEAMEQTHGNIICIKAKERNYGQAERPDCGLIVIPVVIERPTCDEELYAAVSRMTEVTVIGHGMVPMPSEFIVWKGTPEEFQETWRGD
jgi:hypothetical protein